LLASITRGRRTRQRRASRTDKRTASRHHVTHRLVEVGFKDATVRGCGLVMRSTDKAGAEIHSLGTSL